MENGDSNNRVGRGKESGKKSIHFLKLIIQSELTRIWICILHISKTGKCEHTNYLSPCTNSSLGNIIARVIYFRHDGQKYLGQAK